LRIFSGFPFSPRRDRPRAYSEVSAFNFPADVTLKLDADGESIVWRTQVCFFDFPSADEETVILGYAAFLDYLTATFDGQAGILTLIPNSDLPSTA
jgi:hypothetical protein